MFKPFKSFNHFAPFKTFEGMKTRPELHVSGILETSKFMLMTCLPVEENEKIKQECGEDGSEKLTGKLRSASMFVIGGTLRPPGGARNESKNSLIFWR